MTLERPRPFFIGDHLALDFLNTVAKPQGIVVDWLENRGDLVDWLEQAGSLSPTVAAKMRSVRPSALDEVARKARKFRLWLREFVTQRMGKPLRTTTAALAPLNELLAADTSVERVEATARGTEGGRGLLLRKVHRWENPDELLGPIAEAAADLICHQDFQLIRSCEGSGCILMFLDRTRGRARRWCSMAVCGNRAKAAAHRARRTRGD